jgi:hypothetical protein
LRRIEAKAMAMAVVSAVKGAGGLIMSSFVPRVLFLLGKQI